VRVLAGEMRAALPGVADPFPGLRSFESDEEIIFRGRQRHTDELLRRLSSHRFLAVVGTSGSGKSSLVRAGLLPALDRGYLAGATSRWRIAVMRPGMAPIENLAEALRDGEALGAADAERLKSSSLGLVEAVREAKLGIGESLLVVADQFEELFRYQRRMTEIDGGAEAAMFVNLLLTAANRPDAPVYVVLTMRSDFLGDCAQFPGLPEALSESQYLIPRLTREQRRQAIEEPLRLFRATMTPQLVEQLLNDSGDEFGDLPAISHYRGGAPDPLPLLQHALMRTYLEWKSLPRDEGDGRIDLKHYRDAGGMASALNQHAERVFTKDLDDAGRRWAERIFRCLTTTELGRPTRRPTPLADLYKVVGAGEEDRPKIDEVLAVFRRRENFFLRLNKDTSVDISHESLIWKWKRLSDWVADEAAGAELYLDLVKDARGKATWGEPKLSSALGVRDRDAWNGYWARQYSESEFNEVDPFFSRSRKVVRHQRWLRWFALAVPIVGLIFGLLVILRFQNLKNQEQVAVINGRESYESEVADRVKRANDIQNRITELQANQGATQEDRDRIVKEKLALEGQLSKSLTDSQKLTAEAQQSTDWAASAKSLQNRLDQAQKERDQAVQDRNAETQKRQDAESQLAQLQARVNAPSKDGGSTPVVSAPKAEPAKDTPVASPKQAPPPVAADVQPLRTLKSDSPLLGVAWSPDSKMLASGGFGNTIQLWDTANGQPISTLKGHQETVRSVAWTRDGKTLASGSDDKTVKLWNVATGQLLSTLQGPGKAVYSVSWSPDGKTLASASDDKTVRLWNVGSGQPLRTLQGHRDSVRSVAWSPDGKMLASASRDKTIRLWNPTSGQPLRTMMGGSVVTCVAWNPKGKTLASGDLDGAVRLWDTAVGQLLRTLQGRDYVNSVAWSPDGKILASGGGDGTVMLWDAASGQLLRTLQGRQKGVESVAWSPDGKMLASAGDDPLILLWDAAAVRK
jgi:hypothetical protein